MNEQTLNFNHNSVACVKQVTHWGYDTYHNICSLTSVDIQWGWGQWASVWFGGILLVLTILGIMAFINDVCKRSY